jgi:hypothetical protein
MSKIGFYALVDIPAKNVIILFIKIELFQQSRTSFNIKIKILISFFLKNNRNCFLTMDLTFKLNGCRVRMIT